MLKVVYPGTFDPFTRGHEDVVRRASRLFDEIIIGVATSESKGPLFSVSERVAMAREVFADFANVRPLGFSGLLMEFVRSVGATVVLRGLRAVSDFEYEFQMAGMNSRINSDVETLFLMASDRFQFISSRFVKEIGMLGGNVTPFVSARVAKRIAERFNGGGTRKRR